MSSRVMRSRRNVNYSMTWQSYDLGSKGRYGESLQITSFAFTSWIMNEWSRYMGTPPNTIERSHNRKVLVNFHMLLVNLTIKYFNDVIVVKSIEFNVFTLFRNLPNYIRCSRPKSCLIHAILKKNLFKSMINMHVTFNF